MGRSQVLYNRTKGRYKNRAKQSSSQDDTTSLSTNRPNDERRSPGHYVGGRGSGNVTNNCQHQGPMNAATPLPQTTINTKLRPKIDESILLADPTNYSQYPNAKHTVVADIEGGFFVGDGAIDIPSMATTLVETITVSQRLKVAPHVAQALYRVAASVPLASSSQDLPSRGDKATTTLGDDVASVGSFSVAQMKLRVATDGNVEIRPKSSSGVLNAGGLATFPEDSEIDSNNAAQRLQEKLMYDGSNYLDPIQIPPEDDDDVVVEEASRQGLESYPSSIGEDQDRYFVGYDDSFPPGDSDDQVVPQNLLRRAGKPGLTSRTNHSQQDYDFFDDKTDLQDWLDNAIDTSKQEQTSHTTHHHLIVAPGGRYIMAESTVGDYSTITSASTSASASASGSRMIESVIMPPSCFCAIDSRGKLFEKESFQDDNGQASKKFEPATKGDGEDLDAWLDSVIS